MTSPRGEAGHVAVLGTGLIGTSIATAPATPPIIATMASRLVLPRRSAIIAAAVNPRPATTMMPMARSTVSQPSHWAPKTML